MIKYFSLAAVFVSLSVWSSPGMAEDFTDDLRCVGLMSAASNVYKVQSRAKSRGFSAFSSDLRARVTGAMGGRAMTETEKAAFAEGMRAFDYTKLRDMDEAARRAYTEAKFAEADACAERVTGPRPQ